MNKLFYTLFLSFLFILLPMGLSASENPDDPDGDEVEIIVSERPEYTPEKGQRMPSAPYICRLSQNAGIQISGIDTSLIESFEILDSYGSPIAVFPDEESFLETLFSLQGEYRLIFRLNDRTLSGWIEL